MTDIIFFLKDRAENLEVYSLKNSCNIRQSNSRKFTAIPKKELPSFLCYLRSTLEDCQDAMTVGEVEQYLGFKRSTITNWCSKGQLKAIPYNGSYRIPKVHLIKYIINMEDNLLWNRSSNSYKRLINYYEIWKLREKQ